MVEASETTKDRDQSQGSDPQDPLVQVLVRVRRSQRAWARSRGFNLSGLIRRLLDEEQRRDSAPTIEKETP